MRQPRLNVVPTWQWSIPGPGRKPEASQNLLASLPQELRDLIFSYLLVCEDRPVAIGLGDKDDELIVSGEYHEQGMAPEYNLKHSIFRVRWMEILGTCRQFQLEGLQMLLGRNMLLHIGSGWPRRPFTVAKKTMRISASSYIPLFKRVFITIPWQSIHFTTKDRISIMLLLHRVFQYKSKLEFLCVCSDLILYNQRSGDPDLDGAEFHHSRIDEIVPFAMRLRLKCASFTSQNTFANRLRPNRMADLLATFYLTEFLLVEVTGHENIRKNRLDGVAYLHMLRRSFDLSMVRVLSVQADNPSDRHGEDYADANRSNNLVRTAKLQEVFRTDRQLGALVHDDKWPALVSSAARCFICHNQLLLQDGSTASHCLCDPGTQHALYEQMDFSFPMKSGYQQRLGERTSKPEDVRLSWTDYECLRQTLIWNLELAANSPGQTRLTDYFATVAR